MKRKLALLAISVLVLTPAAAEARPGSLDRSFGRGGKVIAPLQLPSEGQRSTPTAIAKLKDGGAVVLASNTLFAFKRDGKLARSFGGGIVHVTAPSSGSLDMVDVVSDREGRIIVGGTISSPLDPSQWGVYADESVFLARYEPDGSLDPSFGEGGTLLTDLGASAPPVTAFPGQPTAAPPLSRLAGVAIDPAGRIVLSGLRVSRIAPCRGFVSIRDWESYAARLRDGGELDPSFGGGVVALPLPAGAGGMPPLLTRSGGVYLWVHGSGCSVAPSQLTRFGSNGQRVAAFGEGGSLVVHNEAVTNLAIDREGRIVILSSGGEPAKLELEAPLATVLRVLPNGKMDTSFGKRGKVTLTAPRPFSVVSSAVAVDRFGRIVLAGTARSAKDGEGPRSFFVERLTARGDVDPRFGKVGYARARFGRHSEAQASSLALVPEGGILVAGTFTRPSAPVGEGLALTRLTSR